MHDQQGLAAFFLEGHGGGGALACQEAAASTAVASVLVRVGGATEKYQRPRSAKLLVAKGFAAEPSTATSSHLHLLGRAGKDSNVRPMATYQGKRQGWTTSLRLREILPNLNQCPLGAESAPISVARQGPLTCPLATFAVAICNVSSTSTPAVRIAQIPVSRCRLGERGKATCLQTLPLVRAAAGKASDAGSCATLLSRPS